jgi:2,3-dihydroxybenzoate-AMP ligase
VENLILMHPAVQNVACVPVSDPNLGEKMCACIVLKKNETLKFAELIDFLKGKEIAKFKLPESLLICEDFPVSTFGKVSKKALGELAEKNAHH